MADSKLSDLSAVTSLLSTDELLLARSGVSKKITAANTLLFDAYALIRDERSSGTQGGAATTTTWTARTLNTESFDPAGIVSVASNKITLGAGTYFIEARMLFFRTGLTKVKLYNVTDAADTLIGESASGETTVNGEGSITCTVEGRVTIAGTKDFEVRYYVTSNDSGNTKCLGPATSASVVEVYGSVKIWREI